MAAFGYHFLDYPIPLSVSIVLIDLLEGSGDEADVLKQFAVGTAKIQFLAQGKRILLTGTVGEILLNRVFWQSKVGIAGYIL